MDTTDEEVVLLAAIQIIIAAYAYLLKMRERRWWIRPTLQGREGAYESLFLKMKLYDPEEFFRYTRMLPEQFDKLLNMLKPKLLKRSNRGNIEPSKRLAITIKYLAHGGSFRNIGWEFAIGQSTVSKVIKETCDAIWEVLQPIYLRTPDEKEWENISDRFSERWNLPHTVGAIDGKHVTIQCPFNSGSEYFSYKQNFSIVLMACCDANYRFLWIDIGAFGSEHDAGIFRRSVMGQKLEEGLVPLPEPRALKGSEIIMPYFFVGDEAFPLRNYLMRPYPGRNLQNTQKIFNYRLSRARRVIENSFGILASRWRVYRAPFLCSVPTTESIVKATLCLHNYLREEILNKYSPPSLLDQEINGKITEGSWRNITRGDKNLQRLGRVGSNNAPRAVTALRNDLASYLESDAGSVPWQVRAINRGRLNT